MSLSRTVHGERIGGHVPRRISVALDPCELGVCSCELSLINALDDGFDDVAVVHVLAGRILPTVRFPLDEPLCDTLDSVVRVTVNMYVLVDWRNVDGALDSDQLRALICLFLPLKRL